jgi:hypothetical protein
MARKYLEMPTLHDESEDLIRYGADPDGFVPPGDGVAERAAALLARPSAGELEETMRDAGIVELVVADRLPPIVSGTIMRNRRPQNPVWTSGPDGPVMVDWEEGLEGFGNERGSYRPEPGAQRNEAGRMPWRFERFEPMGVQEARERGLLMDGDGGTGAPFERFGRQLRGAPAVRERLQGARRADDAQMSVASAGSDPFGLAETRALRWGQSGPTSAVGRAVAARRAEGSAARRYAAGTERAVAAAREEAAGLAAAAEAKAASTAARRGMTPAQAMSAWREAQKIRYGDQLKGVRGDPAEADRQEAMIRRQIPELFAEDDAAKAAQNPSPQSYTQSEAMALPPGTIYLGKDGKRHRRQ